MEIPLLSSSSEDIGVGLSDCDLYVTYKLYRISIDENANKSKRVAFKPSNLLPVPVLRIRIRDPGLGAF
jgi:hypothetical protein